MNKTYKKILIINSTQIGSNSGTGNTLKNIFNLIPNDKLLQIIIHPLEKNNHSNINTIIFGTEVLGLTGFISKIIHKNAINVSSSNVKTQNNCINIPKKSFKHKLKEMFSGILDSLPLFYEEIFKEVEKFKPDVIYTCAASIPIMKTALKISKKYNIPIVVHLMDDWPETIYTSSILSKPSRLYALYLLKKIFRMSSINFVISEALGMKYKKIYGINYCVLMNPVVVNEIEPTVDKNVISFLYAGSLGLKRDESLIKICKAIKILNNQGYNCKIDLYIPKTQNIEEIRTKFLEFDVTFHNYVPADKTRQLYRKYDVLVFSESFDKKLTLFTKYSLSTKIPEYLSSGRPILAFIPENLYSSYYLKENNAAVVANNENELLLCCKKMLDDKKFCNEISNNGYVLVKKNHSIESAKRKLDMVFELKNKNIFEGKTSE